MVRPHDTTSVGGYENPFRSVRHLVPERIDMGVDYNGSGPVYALGDGVITAVNYSWAGGVGAVGPGTWIVWRATKGPLSGHHVYLAENVTPKVRQGQHVTASTVIAEMTGLGAGIETGFAADAPEGEFGWTLAAQHAQQSTGGDPGAWSTAAGAAYSAILRHLGCPPGIMSRGGPHGTNPSWLNDVMASVPGWDLVGMTFAGFASDSRLLQAVARQLALDAQDMVTQGTRMQAIGRAGWRP